MSQAHTPSAPLAEVYDVAVVGGGINGVGIAADAAGRGLSVFLCEQHDLAQHTSSASSKLIHNGLRADHATEQEKPGQHSFWILAVTALATSIDALAVGVGLAFVDVNIFLAAGAIGLATMTMVTLGTMLGRALGAVTGKRAEMVGGVVLILVGATILYEHLSAA